MSANSVTSITAGTIGAGDQLAEIIMGVAWLGAAYGIAMIWCAFTLLNRWRGPHGERGFSMFSVIAAFIISAAWPVVLLYLLTTGN